MAKIKLLVDTDIFIEYFNSGLFSSILEGRGFSIYYSTVTKKELLSKKGLKDSQRKAILSVLRKYGIIRIDAKISSTYSSLRQKHPILEKEDALITATALVKKLPLITRNWKHYKNIEGLTLFTGKAL